jgi:hypothetical protein
MNIKDIAFEFMLFPNSNGDFVIAEAVNDEHFKTGLLDDVEDFIKKNPSTKEITNPIYFVRPGVPTPDGLLSNDIFGITKEERSGIWGYIDLSDWFMHPLIYKKWIRMDSRIRDIVHGTKTYIINEQGDFEESPDGKNGINFIRNNIDKIKIKSTGTEKREDYIKFIDMNKDRMFMKKYLVIPAYYRDVNTTDSGNVGVGEINKLYNSLLISVRSIKETEDYGLSMSNAAKGRIQETILAIYDWLVGNSNPVLEGSSGLSKKEGYIKKAGKDKTTDFGSRLVLSAPELKVEMVDDIMVGVQQSAVPLASICANFEPYMIFQVKRFFENEFAPGSDYPFLNTDGTETRVKVKDSQLFFSDERIKEEIERFIHGYSNRFVPVEVPLTDSNGKTSLKHIRFKGTYTDLNQKITDENPGKSVLINRYMTWCDVLYIAACEVTKNKTVLITRYPIDSCYNQFPTKIVVSSTKETEPVYYNGELYRYYPKIRDEYVNTNTSNSFIDTLMISNLMLSAIGGDYDGDQTSVKGVFTKEANNELLKFMNSKANYIGFNGECIRTSSNEAIQSIYDLTRVLPGTKIDEAMQF